MGTGTSKENTNESELTKTEYVDSTRSLQEYFNEEKPINTYITEPGKTFISKPISKISGNALNYISKFFSEEVNQLFTSESLIALLKLLFWSTPSWIVLFIFFIFILILEVGRNYNPNNNFFTILIFIMYLIPTIVTVFISLNPFIDSQEVNKYVKYLAYFFFTSLLFIFPSLFIYSIFFTIIFPDCLFLIPILMIITFCTYYINEPGSKQLGIAVLVFIAMWYFYYKNPGDVVNKYGFFVLFVSLCISAFLFYINLRVRDPITNLFYDSVKYIILMFCFIFIFCLIYKMNPGNFLNKNIWVTIPLMFIIILFFVYLFWYIFMYIYADKFTSYNIDYWKKQINKVLIVSAGGFFWLFLLFLIIGTYFSSTMNITQFFIYVALILFVIACVGLYVLRYSKLLNLSDTNQSVSSMFSYFIVLIFGIFFVGLMSTLLYRSTQNLNTPLSIIKLILTIFVVIAIMGIVFKLFERTDLYLESPLLQFFINTYFYLPCLLIGIIDLSILYSGGNPSRDSIVVLILIVITYSIYFGYPRIKKWRENKKGLTLVTDAVNLSKQVTLATYNDLSQFISNKESFVSSIDTLSTTRDSQSNSDPYNYRYGISFSAFFDVNDPNDTYISILNFGGKPNILYNPAKNNFLVGMDQEDAIAITESKDVSYNLDNMDIVYESTDIPLQKWNDYVINYDSGVMDIFVNGELVKSKKVVVPFMKYDSITIGQDKGMQGGIRDVMYDKEPILMNL